MDPAEHLPVELLRRIIEVAPSLNDGKIPQRRAAEFRTLLYTLSLVHHIWLEVSRTYLYSDIIIGKERCMLALMRTFDEQPERASLCRRFELQGDGGTGGWRLRVIEEALERCHALRDLGVDGAQAAWPSAWETLLGESKASVRCEPTLTFFVSYSATVHLHPQTPRVHHLHILGGPPLPPNACSRRRIAPSRQHSAD